MFLSVLFHSVLRTLVMPLGSWCLILTVSPFHGCSENKQRLNTPRTDQVVVGEAPKGMVWIPGGSFVKGGVKGDPHALPHEFPNKEITVRGFFMDITPVTNAQFSEFVSATGYVTLAERTPDWEELKKQLPKNAERPPDSVLQAGSMVFFKSNEPVTDFRDISQWWKWTLGAVWKHPKGPKSNIKGLDAHPVVHIAYEDALAYCKWAKRRLPTEEEWEFAARAGKSNFIHFWGNNATELSKFANTWEGDFPYANQKKDGFESTSPVANYPPNVYGLYDMAGNVWEWTGTSYDNGYGNVIKGGSFLCNASYCASYRISARMGSAIDSSTDHIGFRTVKDP